MTRSCFRTISFFFLCVQLAAVTLPEQAFCETPGLEKIDRGLQKNESDLERLERGMQIYLGKLQVIGEEEFDLLGEIERLDKGLALQKIRLEVMVERLNSQEELLAIKKRDLKLAQEEMVKVREHLQKRLRSYYLMGKTGILNVTFSTRTLPDLMLFNDSFMALIDYDKRIFDAYRESISQLTLARDGHEKESILLNQFIADAVEQQQELDSLLAEKSELLKKVKTQKTLHEQAVKELKKAESELRGTLAQLQKKRDYTLKGFVMSKGRMPPPVQGRVLTRFGEPRDSGALGTGPSQGITFDAPNGAPVRAIFAGRIIYAAYRQGFGNMVIIDHGLNYFSITARMEKIGVKEGQSVEAGETIGSAGDIATLFEKGMYFEIRYDTEPLDPMEWITIGQ